MSFFMFQTDENDIENNLITFINIIILKFDINILILYTLNRGVSYE